MKFYNGSFFISGQNSCRPRVLKVQLLKCAHSDIHSIVKPLDGLLSISDIFQEIHDCNTSEIDSGPPSKSLKSMCQVVFECHGST